MSGYRREPRVYRLYFEDPSMAGLEVRMRSVPIGQFMDIMAMAAGVSIDTAPATIEGLFRGFASALVSWNLEEDGPNGPYDVPPTLEGVRTQEIDFIMEIVGAWLGVISGAPGPLGKDSAAGETAPEGSPQTAAS